MEKIRKNSYSNIFRQIKLILLYALLLSTGCKSFIEIDPPSDTINSLNVYSQNATAIAAVTQMYAGFATGSNGYTLNPGLSADEFTLFNGVTSPFRIANYRNEFRTNVTPTLDHGRSLQWVSSYPSIFLANSAIEGLSASTELYSVVKQQLLGESYFMRAFYYFYLTGYYGDVPLAITSDPNINTLLPRTPQTKVYEQIVSDLNKARELLSPLYVDANIAAYTSEAQRVRPTKWAATAMLARVYLYMKRYAEAETMASEVISQQSLFSLLPLNEVFIKNSREAILQFQPVRTGRNTDEGFMYILPANGPTSSVNPVYLSNSLRNAFEPGDARATLGNWVNRVTTSGGQTYTYPFKYKSKTSVVTEYIMVLRLAEQYLIRAEARAQLGKLTGPNSSASDLNAVRGRAGLAPTSETTQDALLEAILKERRVELFAEWGHRWLDLKRTGKVDEVMRIATAEKGGIWESYQQWYPIPYSDIQRAPNLRQNPGYQ